MLMTRSLTMICLLIFTALSCTQEGPVETGPTIAVIPKGTTHAFWNSVERGAQKAGKDLGVNIVWKGPLKEDDRAQQIALMEQFVSEQVSGIVLAPLDEKALLRPVLSAKTNQIPVVIIDSALEGVVGEDFASFVGTDNLQGGRLAGEHAVEILQGSGKVVLLRCMIGSASTTRRENGFLEVVTQHPEIEILVDNQYAGATAGEAIQKSEELLDFLRQADAIFCPNESVTFGMLVTLRKHHLAGKVKFIGFDASDELILALRNGEIDGLVVQDPERMGYEGVQTVFRHIRNQEIPLRLDTGVKLVTTENLDDEEIQTILRTD